MIERDTIAIGPEPADAAVVAIFMHGRHRTPDEMRDLALRLALPPLRFIMPAAPGGTWYPESFLAPFDQNEPGLSRSLAGYAQIEIAAMRDMLSCLAARSAMGHAAAPAAAGHRH